MEINTNYSLLLKLLDTASKDPLVSVDYNFAKLQTIWAEVFDARWLPQAEHNVIM